MFKRRLFLFAVAVFLLPAIHVHAQLIDGRIEIDLPPMTGKWYKEAQVTVTFNDPAGIVPKMVQYSTIPSAPFGEQDNCGWVPPDPAHAFLVDGPGTFYITPGWHAGACDPALPFMPTIITPVLYDDGAQRYIYQADDGNGGSAMINIQIIDAHGGGAAAAAVGVKGTVQVTKVRKDLQMQHLDKNKNDVPKGKHQL